MLPHEQVEFDLAIDQFKREMGNHIKLCELHAENMFEYYNALMRKGFNSNQALQIVIAHGIYPGNVKP